MYLQRDFFWTLNLGDEQALKEWIYANHTICQLLSKDKFIVYTVLCVNLLARNTRRNILQWGGGLYLVHTILSILDHKMT